MTEILSAVGQPGVDLKQLIHGDAIPGTEHRFSELFERYKTSIYGIFHAEQDPRFSNKYRWDYSQMLLDLGDDVHPVHHMSHTEERIVRPLLDHQLRGSEDGRQALEPGQIIAVRLAALVHDMGECEHPELKEVFGETVGDVYYAAKTDEHENAEARIRAYFYGKLYGDVPTELLRVAEEIVRNPGASHEGRAFKVAEHIGYFTTGILAGVTAIELKDHGVTDEAEQRFRELSRLGLDVSARWHPVLQEHGEHFPYAAHVADTHKPALDAIQQRLA